jgi:hypothetical protein
MIKPTDFALILKIVRYVSLAVSILLILRMFRTFRRTRTISRKSCVVAALFPLVTLVIYFVIIGSKLTVPALSALSVFGLALGIVQGRKTRVWQEKGKARAQNTLWFLVVWAVSYATMQTLIVVGNTLSLNVGIGGMFVSTAIAVGSQGLLFVRLSLPGGLLDGPAFASATTASPSSSARRFCPACGAPATAGDRFCRSCRAPLD